MSAIATPRVAGGGSNVFTSPIQYSYTGNLTALAGGAQAGTALNSELNEFATVATPFDSAQLPAGASGQVLRRVVKNATNVPLAVFPQTGSKIGAWATNGFDIVAPQSEREYLNYGASTTWIPRSIADQNDNIFEEEYDGYDPASGAGPGRLNWLANVTGTGANTASVAGDQQAGHPGILALTTGTTTTGQASSYASSGNAGMKFGGGTWHRMDFLVYLSALSTVGDEYALYLGWGDSSSAEASNGIYAYYDRANDGNFWGLKAANGGVRSKVVTSVATAATTWTHLIICVAADGSRADLIVNGTFATSGSPVTTNFPTGSVFYQNTIKKSAGTTSIKALLDWWRLQEKFTTSRW